MAFRHLRPAGDPEAHAFPATNLAAEMFAALGDLTRLRIVRVFIEDGRALPFKFVVRALGLPRPTVSRHLRVLWNVGWLDRHRAGRKTFYRLKPDDLPAGPALVRTIAKLPRYEAEPDLRRLRPGRYATMDAIRALRRPDPPSGPAVAGERRSPYRVRRRRSTA